MIAEYSEFSELLLEQRPVLHRRFHRLVDGISEFTFAGLYLFRNVPRYAISRLDADRYVVSGYDAQPSFMLPFGLPAPSILAELFDRFGVMKCVTETLAEQLASRGYCLKADRDNFDYLYDRQELVTLAGRKFHRKKNQVNLFVRSNVCLAMPLLTEFVPDALQVLEAWRARQDSQGDYASAREALETMEALQLCGGIFSAHGLGHFAAGGTGSVARAQKQRPLFWRLPTPYGHRS